MAALPDRCQSRRQAAALCDGGTNWRTHGTVLGEYITVAGVGGVGGGRQAGALHPWRVKLAGEHGRNGTEHIECKVGA